MRTQYITVLPGVPKIVPLDTDMKAFQVTIKTNTADVDVTVDNVQDPKVVPVWYPATVSAIVPGAYILDAVVSAVRFSSAGGETVKLDQTGSFRDGPPTAGPPVPPLDPVQQVVATFAGGLGGYFIKFDDPTKLWADQAGTVPIAGVDTILGRVNDISGNGNDFTFVNTLYTSPVAGKFVASANGVSTQGLSAAVVPAGSVNNQFVTVAMGIHRNTPAGPAQVIADAGIITPGSWSMSAPTFASTNEVRWTVRGSISAKACPVLNQVSASNIIYGFAQLPANQPQMYLDVDGVIATSSAPNGTGNPWAALAHKLFVHSISGANFFDGTLSALYVRYGPQLTSAEETNLKSVITSLNV